MTRTTTTFSKQNAFLRVVSAVHRYMESCSHSCAHCGALHFYADLQTRVLHSYTELEMVLFSQLPTCNRSPRSFWGVVCRRLEQERSEDGTKKRSIDTVLVTMLRDPLRRLRRYEGVQTIGRNSQRHRYSQPVTLKTNCEQLFLFVQ